MSSARAVVLSWICICLIVTHAIAQPAPRKSGIEEQTRKLDEAITRAREDIGRLKAGAPSQDLAAALRTAFELVGISNRVQAAKIDALKADIERLVVSDSRKEKLISDVQASIATVVKQEPDHQKLAADVLAKVLPTLQLLLAEQVERRLSTLHDELVAFKSSLSEVSRTTASNSDEIIKLWAKVADMASRGSVAEKRLEPAKQQINPEVYKIQTRLIQTRSGGMRGNQAKGSTKLLAMVEGKEVPVRDVVLTVTWSPDPDGTERTVGDFRTDLDGRAFYSFRIPDRKQASKMFTHVRFAGDEVYRSAESAPVQVGISS